MTTPVPTPAAPAVPDSPVTAGVDTHKDTHHVGVLAATGAKLGDLKVPATPAGYQQLLDFVLSFGAIALIGIEGTNSYGAGLARFLTAAGIPIREVIRPKRAHVGGGSRTRSMPTPPPARPSPSPTRCPSRRARMPASSRSGSCWLSAAPR